MDLFFWKKPKQKTYGTHGRIEIPVLRISLPLYEAKNGNAQKIVDDKFWHGTIDEYAELSDIDPDRFYFIEY